MPRLELDVQFYVQKICGDPRPNVETRRGSLQSCLHSYFHITLLCTEGGSLLHWKDVEKAIGLHSSEKDVGILMYCWKAVGVSQPTECVFWFHRMPSYYFCVLLSKKQNTMPVPCFTHQRLVDDANLRSDGRCVANLWEDRASLHTRRTGKRVMYGSLRSDVDLRRASHTCWHASGIWASFRQHNITRQPVQG